jgi:hypothetical protein
MAAIVEKPDGTLVVLVHLTLKPGRDDALIELICSAPNPGLATLIRETMRSGVKLDQHSLYQESEVELEISDFGIEL